MSQPESSTPAAASGSLTLAELQRLIRAMYGRKDEQRGPEGTYLYLMEEVGELASALRACRDEKKNANVAHDELAAEFADCLAWLATLANVMNVDLTTAVQRKYAGGCPGCGRMLCTCDSSAKP